RCSSTRNVTIYAYGHSMKYNKTVAPTCTAQGYELHKCSRSGCTSTTKKNYKAATGHNLVNYTYKPTCTAEGYSYKYCTRTGCKYKTDKTNVVSALGHNYKNKQTAKPATCTTDGVMIQACANLGCTSTRNVTIKAYGHNMKYNKTVAPTCTAQGYELHKCSRSGCTSTTKKNYKSATGHNYKDKQTAKPATCTTDGVMIQACANSGCTSTKNVTIKAYGHNYSWVTKVAPTCTKTGTRQYKCTRSGCGNVSKTETLKATGHNYKNKQTAKPATCTTNGVMIQVCANSGCTSTRNVTIKAYGHNLSSWTIVSQPTKNANGKKTRKCTRSGCTYKEEDIIPQLGSLSVEDCNTSTFYFRADGSLDYNMHSWPLYYQKSNSVNYLRLRFNSNVDWKVSSTSSFVNFMDSNLKKISSGKSGDNEVIINLSAMPINYEKNSRNFSITITANNVSKTYNISQCNRAINGLSKEVYFDSIKNVISNVSANNDALNAIKGNVLTNGKIVEYKIGDFKRLAVKSELNSYNDVIIDYVLYQVEINKQTNETKGRLEVIQSDGLNLSQGNAPIFTTNGKINCGITNSTDQVYERDVRVGNTIVWGISNLAAFGLGFIDGPSPVADFTIGVAVDTTIGWVGNAIVSVVTTNNGANGVVTTTSYTLSDGCVLSGKNDKIEMTCENNNTSTTSLTIKWIVTDGNGTIITKSQS
ncbi:MAG: BACON domain-containing protein, partial [Ruminococcus sp.]|nr:BACON domain-containing protein [Ruminococcus sp.]